MGFIRNVIFQPMKVPHLRGRRSNNKKFILPYPGHRQISFNSATVVQPLCVDCAPYGYVNLVSADTVQDRNRIPTSHLKLGKGSLIKKTNPFPHSPMLFGRLLKPVLAAITVFVRGRCFARAVPISPFPARCLAKTGTGCPQTVVQWRFSCAPGCLVLVKGPMHRIEQT